MGYFPDPNFTNGILSLFEYANTLTGDLFMALVPVLNLVAITGSLIVSGYSFSKALLSASFVSLITSILLRALGLISDTVTSVLFIILAVSIVYANI